MSQRALLLRKMVTAFQQLMYQSLPQLSVEVLVQVIMVCADVYSPRFMWMRPNARISVMGGDQAAGVLSTVRQSALAKEKTQQLRNLKL